MRCTAFAASVVCFGDGMCTDLVASCSSGRVCVTNGKCSKLRSSAAHHFRPAVWGVRIFGYSLAGKCLVLYDELDLSDLGDLRKRVKCRWPSERSSNRGCRNHWNRVVYCVRCDANTKPNADAQVSALPDRCIGWYDDGPLWDELLTVAAPRPTFLSALSSTRVPKSGPLLRSTTLAPRTPTPSTASPSYAPRFC